MADLSEEEKIRIWKQQLEQEMDEEDETQHLAPQKKGAKVEDDMDRFEKKLKQMKLNSGVEPDSMDESSEDDEDNGYHAAVGMPLPSMQSDISFAKKTSPTAMMTPGTKGFSRDPYAGDVLSEHELAALGELQDVKASKLVELAKKNRRLSVALSKERSRAMKAEAELKRWQNGKEDEPLPPTTDKKMKKKDMDADTESTVSAADQAEDWRNKYLQASNKLQELRVQSQQWKNEVSKLQRALVKEIGEDVPLDKATDDGYRGRAQQIELLKGKVKELTLKLQKQSQLTAESDLVSPTNAVVESGFDVRHRETIVVKADERRKEFDRLQIQFTEQQEELNKTKQRFEAVKSRNQTLENEVKSLKNKIQLCLDTAANDEKLVAALRTELDRLRSNPPNASKLEPISTARSVSSGRSRTAADKRGSANQGRTDSAPLEEEIRTLKAALAEQEQKLDRKQQLVDGLKAERLQLKQLLKRFEEPKQQDEVEFTDLTHRCRLLQVEKEKLEELVNVLKNRFNEANAHVETLSKELSELKRSKSEPEKKGMRPPAPTSSSQDKLAQLKDKLSSAQEEIRTLRASFGAAMATKEEEVAILKDMSKQQQTIYESAVQDLKRSKRLGSAGRQNSGLSEGADPQIIENLANENDQLRKELKDVKLKYKYAMRDS
eukprot:GILK01007476.1.p1 GENE.GILK01007476.1~~GILK01007476.1.p1  ORF type:complete len:680 (+),score=214.14 GILK01007476.1:53-2041(+)